VDVFGARFVSYNVHSLIHLASDCEHFGVSLDAISAFPFENYLYRFKRRLKHSSNALVQLAKCIEGERRLNGNVIDSDVCSVRQPKLSTKFKDSFFMSTSGKLCIVREVLDGGSQFVCELIPRQNMTNLFVTPLPSSARNIFRCSRLASKTRKILRVEDVARKVVVVPMEDNGYAIIPLLHCPTSSFLNTA